MREHCMLLLVAKTILIQYVVYRSDRIPRHQLYAYAQPKHKLIPLIQDLGYTSYMEDIPTVL